MPCRAPATQPLFGPSAPPPTTTTTPPTPPPPRRCPLAAIVDGSVLCVHGGLSPELRTIDQMRLIDRRQEIPHEGSFCDLMWSDPDDIETWAVRSNSTIRIEFPSQRRPRARTHARIVTRVRPHPRPARKPRLKALLSTVREAPDGSSAPRRHPSSTKSMASSSSAERTSSSRRARAAVPQEPRGPRLPTCPQHARAAPTPLLLPAENAGGLRVQIR